MKRTVLAVFVVCLAFAGEGLAAMAPVTGSPGSPHRVALIGDGCPTFSWGEVKGADSYELVVYRVGDDTEDAVAVLRQEFAGSVDSWTPSLDRCLERGGQYAWSVRAVGVKKASEWSPPSLFQVAAGPSDAELEEALTLVQRYLEQEGRGDTPARRVTRNPESSRGSVADAGPSIPSVSEAPILQANVVGGDSDLQVNGSAAVTTETLGLFSGYVSSNGTKEGMGAFTSSRISAGRYTINFDFTGLQVPSGRMPMVIVATASNLCADHSIAQADWASISFSGGFVLNMNFTVETFTAGVAADCSFSFSATYASTSNSLGPSPSPEVAGPGPVSNAEVVCRNSPSGMDCN